MIADLIAHYRITAKLGEGGMGEVWRAIDTKLNREVAIKILPDTFANDRDRMARFSREAQVLASLNHPNIAAIYGVEERALILELVEGPSLAERIAAGPIPLAEAVPIARQIAAALECAHDRGVVHRDLKPANIKITPEGQVKVLDFGLAAVAQASAAEPANPLSSPTMTMRATMAGMIMGTAAYMSPEQASGKPVDKRADIWSFGVVLWEMLTGRKLFTGQTISHTLADVLRAEIDLGKLPHGTPPPVRELLRRCLDRDVKTRLRDIGEARVLLERPILEQPEPEPQIARRSSLVPWILAALMAIGGTGLALIHFSEKPAPVQPVHFVVAAPDKTDFAAWLGLSPDGRQLGFTAAGADGLARVWIRPLDSLEARPLAGTEGVNTFFWSPDGRFVAFGTGGKLKKIAISGGPPQTLCDFGGQVLGGSWNTDGVVLFGSSFGPIQRIAASGGAATSITALDPSREEISHIYPTFLPDGRHFVYLRRSPRSDYSGVYAGALDLAPVKQSLRRIQAAQFSPAYAPPTAPSRPGHILFVSEGALMAQAFDEQRLKTAGEPVAIADQVATSVSRAAFSVSANGILAYRGGAGAGWQFEWLNREGRDLGRAGEVGNYGDIAISPDGRRVAHTELGPGASPQIWVLDLARGGNTRLSFLPEGGQASTWSPDGKRIAFSSYISAGTSQVTIYVADAGNGGVDQPLFRSMGFKYLNNWTRDGRFLVYSELVHGTPRYRLFAVPVETGSAERKPIPLVNSEFNEVQGQVSPDSRWLAFASDLSGKYEVYVRPFPPGDGRTGESLISTGGGSQPRWRADGKELFYTTDNGKLMAVDVALRPGPASFQSGAPHALFARPGMARSIALFEYDVAPDGKRFLTLERPAGIASTPATVVLNWEAGLRK